MNLAEKILAAHTDRKQVSPGEFVNARVDVVLSNDITAPIAIKEFQKLGLSRVYDPKQVVMVLDHFMPTRDIASATIAKMMREFCQEQKALFFDR